MSTATKPKPSPGATKRGDAAWKEETTGPWEGWREARGGRPQGTRTSPSSLQYRACSGRLGSAFSWVYGGNVEEEEKGGDVRYYHSGVNRGVFIQWIAEERQRTGLDMGAMLNARSATQPSIIEALAEHEDVPVVLDSGAYQSDPPSIFEYQAVLERINKRLKERGLAGLRSRFEWVANLDVLGGIGTGRNFSRLRSGGIEPLWIGHVKRTETGVRVDLEPPPEGPFELQRGMTVGVGGLVPIIKEDTALAQGAIEKAGEKLARLDLKGHFFGIGSSGLLRQFGGEAWLESADSAKWLAGQKGRKVYREDGSCVMAAKQGLRFSREECARQNIRQIARWGEERQGQTSLLSAG